MREIAGYTVIECKNIPTGALTYSNSYNGDLPVVMNNVQCEGDESRLIDCSYTSGDSGTPVYLRCSSDGTL